MKFLESLTGTDWFWGTSYSLAYACKLTYKDSQIVESVAKSSWEFEECRSFGLDPDNPQGFVASTDKVVLIAFRGTNCVDDFVTDFTFLPTDTGKYSIHEGFRDGFEEVSNCLRESIEAANPDGKKIFITGHSLGGALALISAVEYSDWLPVAGVYTFGQPSVGLNNFCGFTNQRLKGKAFRIVNERDIVPRVPPFPFSHTDTLFHLKSAFKSSRMSPDDMSEKELEIELRETLAELKTYAKLEASSGIEGPVQENRFLGLKEHAIDHYIYRIGKELSAGTRAGFFEQGRISRYFVHLPLPAENALTSPLIDDISAENDVPQLLEKELAEPAAEDLPFSVHVIWSPKCNVPGNPCRGVAESIFEYLSHIPGSDLDVEAGVGIPVFTGHHLIEVRSRVEELEAAAVSVGTCSVVIPLLHVDAVLDKEFEEFVKWLGTKERSHVLVAPVWLDNSWYGVDELVPHASKGAAGSSVPNDEKGDIASREAAIEICRMLMDHRPDPFASIHRRIHVCVSYSRTDLESTNHLAHRIRDYFENDWINGIFEGSDLQEGRSLEEGGDHLNKIILVVRTDSYAGNSRCQRELLEAKRLGLPVVSLSVLDDRETRSLAYGGNSITLAAGKNPDDIEIERVIAACDRACLQSWLRHLHFHHRAPTVFARRNLDVDPSYISRAPELLDFAQGPLDNSATTVVLYPDPPLPSVETDLIRRSFPRVRLATPTTISRETMRRTPSPPLDGILVALSLSNSAGHLSENFRELGTDFIGTNEKGVFRAHLNATVAYLTLSLVRAGSQLGYGGHFAEKGYAHLLDNLIETNRRTKSTNDQIVLHSFLAAHLWEKYPPADQKIQAHFHRFPPEGMEAATDRVDKAMELALMRRAMAQHCFARIILGGKSRPALHAEDRTGYAGRLPGQAEEAIRHLLGGRPVYVAGGFYGAAKMVALALSNQLDDLTRESQFREKSDHYSSFCDEYDRKLPGDDPVPRTLDQLWQKFAEFGEGVFWGDVPEGGIKWIDNGLSVKDNLRLFHSIQADEINSLVMNGLQKSVRKAALHDSAPLKVALFNGSITDVLDVEAYGIAVLPGAKLLGADGALDSAMQGGIIRSLTSSEPDKIIRVDSDKLIGDFVIPERLDDFDIATGSSETLKDCIADCFKKISTRAGDHRIRSLAVVPSGVNLGISPDQSVKTILSALLETRKDSRLDGIAICETNIERFQNVLVTVREMEKEGTIAVSELPPKIPGHIRSPLFITLRTSQDSLQSDTVEVHQSVHGPNSGAAIEKIHQSIGREALLQIVDPNRDASWPYTDSPPDFEEHDVRGSQLADLILTESVKNEILSHRGRAWEVIHDVAGSIFPLEFLAIPIPGTCNQFYRPALDQGIRRRLFVETPSTEPYVFSLPINLLIIADPTDDLQGTREEAELIREQLSPWKDLIKITSLTGSNEASLDAVRDLLGGAKGSNQFDIIHYAGHGNFDLNDPDASGLKFADGTLTAAEIDRFQMEQPPMLVLINACETGTVQNTMTGASLAERILQSGVRGFISNRWTVGDSSAATFAYTIYSDLADGRTLGRAILNARRNLFENGERDWANYVFYGSPEIRLLDNS